MVGASITISVTPVAEAAVKACLARTGVGARPLGRTASRARPTAAEPEPAARLLSFDPLRHVARALGFRNVAASDRR